MTFLGKESESDKMRSCYVEPTPMGLVLAALTPPNRLVMEVMLATGLRVSDALALPTDKVKQQRFTVKESKTGKTRRVYIPSKLQLRLLKQAGRLWVFEGRNSWRRHRTRQAVYKDVKRAAVMFQRAGSVPKELQVSPHSARKVYAVEEYRRSGDIRTVGKALNHSPADVAVTMLYALSDKDTPKKTKKGKKAKAAKKSKKR